MSSAMRARWSLTALLLDAIELQKGSVMRIATVARLAAAQTARCAKLAIPIAVEGTL